MKAKALSLAYTKTFFKGDESGNPLEFDGLEKRLSGGQVIDGNDGVITLLLIDELIDAVEGEPDALLMSKAMRREVKKVLQDSTHYVENGSDAFGRPVATYAGVPIRIVETDAAGNEILGFGELNKAGTLNNTASIYAVRFGAEQYTAGLQWHGKRP